jgi:hypothetical protein
MPRKRHKGNRIGEGFVALPYSVLNSPLFIGLSPHAVKLLIDVAAQYRGDNNGDLSVAWKLMQPRGWRSEATLHKVKRELIDAGFLYETRKGKRPNLCSLFALTWPALDDCHKFDPEAKAGFTRNEFRFKVPLAGPTVPRSANVTTGVQRKRTENARLLHVV